MEDRFILGNPRLNFVQESNARRQEMALEELLGRNVEGQYLVSKGYSIRPAYGGMFMIYKHHVLWYATRMKKNGFDIYNSILRFERKQRPLFEGDET